MPRVVQTAIQHAVGRRGVSVVALSGDTATEDSPDSAPELAMPLDLPAIRPSDQEIARLTELRRSPPSRSVDSRCRRAGRC
ncbi:hypothetical protein ACWDZ8_42230 [Streptomyces sp. NPDC003233]